MHDLLDETRFEECVEPDVQRAPHDREDAVGWFVRQASGKVCESFRECRRDGFRSGRGDLGTAGAYLAIRVAVGIGAGRGGHRRVVLGGRADRGRVGHERGVEVFGDDPHAAAREMAREAADRLLFED